MAYPGRDVGGSYLLESGRVIPLRPSAGHRLDYFLLADGDHRGVVLDVYLDKHGYDLVGARYPVITFGSNRNPDHLAYRFKDIDSCAIPVIKSRLSNASVVFPAHIASYGVVTSTLFNDPGAISDVYLLMLDAEQLSALHRAERTGTNFDLAYLDDCSVQLESGEILYRPCSFVGKHDVARPWGEVHRLSEVASNSKIAPATLEAVMNWLGEAAMGEGLTESSELNELREYAKRSESNREKLRELMKRTGVSHGLSLSPVPSVDGMPPVPVCYQQLDSRLTMDPIPEVLVDETDGRDRVRGSYVISLSPAEARTLGVRHRAAIAVENEFRLREPGNPLMLRAAAHVVIREYPGTRVALDKSLRTALAVRAGDGVSVRRVSMGFLDRVKALIARFFTSQYIYCRVKKAHYPDMEKPVCRIPQEALDVLGVGAGARVVVEGLEPRGDDLQVKARNLKVLEADESVVEARAIAEGKRTTAYYADCEYLLGVNRDIYPIFLDKEVRDFVNTDICGIVRLRRSNRHALGEESLALLVILLGGVIGLAPAVGESSLIGVPAVVLAIAVISLVGIAMVIFNVRKRTP